MSRHALLICIAVLSSFACTGTGSPPASNLPATREASKEIQELTAAINKTQTFFQPMGRPQQYDWLGTYNEPGQTFEEYLDSEPTRPTSERQKIYVLPLGKFTAQQLKVIDVASMYLAEFYDLPVEKMRQRALTPAAEHLREHRDLKARQVKTGYILSDVLQPILPDDAAALIAFTNEDLFPDDSMSFVFGQASLENRVGVWSLHRLDDDADDATFLRRTLKIAAHETGHMFSMRHCRKYECVMSGTNHLGETDRRPVDACPECMAKVCWLSNINPKARYERLAAFCGRNGLKAEAEEFKRKAEAVS